MSEIHYTVIHSITSAAKLHFPFEIQAFTSLQLLPMNTARVSKTVLVYNYYVLFSSLKVKPTFVIKW